MAIYCRNQAPQAIFLTWQHRRQSRYIIRFLPTTHSNNHTLIITIQQYLLLLLLLIHHHHLTLLLHTIHHPIHHHHHRHTLLPTLILHLQPIHRLHTLHLQVILQTLVSNSCLSANHFNFHLLLNFYHIFSFFQDSILRHTEYCDIMLLSQNHHAFGDD